MEITAKTAEQLRLTEQEFELIKTKLGRTPNFNEAQIEKVRPSLVQPYVSICRTGGPIETTLAEKRTRAPEHLRAVQRLGVPAPNGPVVRAWPRRGTKLPGLFVARRVSGA